MAQFDDKVMRNFELYLNLQKSGEINMVSSRVQDMLGISKDEHLFIMNNYSELLNAYNELKVVDEVISDAKERVAGKPGKHKSKGLDDRTFGAESDKEPIE